MITTISKQGGRRYPQMGSSGQPWAGWLPCIGGQVTPPTPPTPDQSTPGFSGRTIRDSYEEWRKRQERPDERARTDEARLVREDDRLRDYVAKADRINAAIAAVRAETATLKAESAALQERITALAKRDRAAAAAKAERALLLKTQALQLAQSREAMLLEELEVLDVGYVALIAYMAATGLLTIN